MYEKEALLGFFCYTRSISSFLFMKTPLQNTPTVPSSFRDEDIEAFQAHLQQTVSLLQTFVEIQESHT